MSAMSDSSIPSSISVRPKNLLLCDIGEPDRKEYQVVRVRKGHSSKGSMKRKSSVENELQSPSGAGGPLTPEALLIEGAEKDLLYVIVGVLLPEVKVAQAEALASNRERKLETIQGFNIAIHGTSIAPKSTSLIRVVLPIWPDGDNDDEASQKSKRSIYRVLCNMENGLCEALPMTGGMYSPNLFFYPEWTRSKTDLTRYMHRSNEWTSTVRNWSSEYRRLQLEASQAPDSGRGELTPGPRAEATPDFLSGQNDWLDAPESDDTPAVRAISKAMGLTAAAPEDAAWRAKIKDLLNPMAPASHSLRMVMDGSEGVDLEIAEHAVREFKVGPCLLPLDSS